MTLCTVINGVSYDLGTAYNCEVAEGVIYKFYISSVNDEKISLIMDRNLGVPVSWCDYTNSNYNGYGPITAFDKLYELTTGWNKLDNIVMNYSDEGGTTFEIVTDSNNVTYISSREPDDYGNSYVNLKARLPYRSEMLSGGSWLGDNLDDYSQMDYWFTSSVSGTVYAATSYIGEMEVLGQDYTGIRLVIEIFLSDLG